MRRNMDQLILDGLPDGHRDNVTFVDYVDERRGGVEFRVDKSENTQTLVLKRTLA